MLPLEYTTTIEGASLPEHKCNGDVGIDITALKLVKKMQDNTFMYDTGICIKPPEGYYTVIAPRSSIVKSGYILTNSIGIIDSDYRGSLKVVLTKVEPNAPPLECPFTLGQIILMKANLIHPVRVESLDDTERGQGGFGSTDQ